MELQESLQYANDLFNSGQVKKAADLLLKITFSEEEKTSGIYAYYCLLTGSALAESGQHQSALQYFDKAETNYRMHNTVSDLGLVLFNKGNVYKYMQNVDLSLSNYLKALDCFVQVKDSEMQINVHLNLAHSYANRYSFQQAMAHAKEIERLEPDEGKRDAVLNWSYYNLQAKFSVISDEKISVGKYLNKALEFAYLSKNESYVAESLELLGRFQFNTGNFAEALELLTKAEKLMEHLGDFRYKSLQEIIEKCSEKLENRKVYEEEWKKYSCLPLQKGDSAYNKLYPRKDVIVVQRAQGLHENFESALRSTKGYFKNYVCVFHNSDAYIAPSSIPQINTEINTDEFDPILIMKNNYSDEDTLLPLLLSVAQRIVQSGVEQKQKLEYLPAFRAYIFGLTMALKTKQSLGIEMIIANLYKLERDISSQTYGGKIGFGYIQLPDDYISFLKELDDQIQFAAGIFIPYIEELLKAGDWNGDDRVFRVLVISLKRLLILSLPGNPFERNRAGEQLTHGKLKRRALLSIIVRTAQRSHDITLILTSLYEEFSELDMDDVDLRMVTSNSKTLHIKADKNKIEEGAYVLDEFKEIWSLYQYFRLEALSDDFRKLLFSCSVAVDHIDKLRAKLVNAGGRFGHELSYSITEYSSVVNRDYINLLYSTNQHAEALEMAERTCAHAMVDWMARTHTNLRLIRRQGFTGSIGEVCNASMEEIMQAAKDSMSVILYYFSVREDFILWVINSDGILTSQIIKSPKGIIENLLENLPYSVDSAILTRSTENFLSIFADFDDVSLINSILQELGQYLIPETVQKLLSNSSDKKLAIITDRELNYVPFACLRIQDQYLVELFEVYYWPSVTAWILCDRTAELWQERRINLKTPLIIGDPVFSNPYVIDDHSSYTFSKLPGSREEALCVANLLNVIPLLGSDATFAAMRARFVEETETSTEEGHDGGEEMPMEFFGGNLLAADKHHTIYGAANPQKLSFIPMIHLATHGIVDMNKPDSSFVALSDGPLSARFLYDYDPGIRSHLVMLSCCQTSLGYMHPDSTIGLTNAFLICGACSVGSSLWQVPDEATKVMMEIFYRTLINGSDLSTAMCQAQRELLKNPFWQHPLYWGAFKITGSNRCPNLFQGQGGKG